MPCLKNHENMGALTLQASVLYAVIVAFLMAFIGYLKKSKEESFAPEKLFITFFSAFIVALLMVTVKLPLEDSENIYNILLIKTGIIHYVQDALKAFLIRVNLGKRVNDWLDKWLPAYR